MTNRQPLMKAGLATVSAGVVAGLIAGAWGARPAAQGAGAQPARSTQVTRGEYLVRTGDCTACHTPWKVGENGPEPDPARYLSGHPATLAVTDPKGLAAPFIGAANPTLTAWSGPWGRSYTANLTSDPETGVGAWTEQQFIATIRNGRHLGDGRPLLPPMPWEPFRLMSDEDLAAIFAYLKTVPAIRNKVPEPVVPAGPAMPPPTALAPVTLKTAPGHGDPVARGKYLVTTKGCGDCHTPMRMGDKGPEYVKERMLSGFDARGPVPAMPPVEGIGEAFALEPVFAGGWGMSFAANLTPDPETGIGTWTEQQFIDTLRNGRHQGRGRQLLPPMPWQAFGQMDDADLKAIFAYLRTVPAIRNRVPDPVTPPPGGTAR